MEIKIGTIVHVPELDSEVESGVAIGEVVGILYFRRDAAPSQLDRILVALPHDLVLCYRDGLQEPPEE